MDRMCYNAVWILPFLETFKQIKNGGGLAMNTRNRRILPILTAIVAALSLLSIVTFIFRNRNNISDNNQEYLRENTRQTALLVDDSLEKGLANIQVLSRLVGGIITSPELDIPLLQSTIGDSIFDFIEFVDMEGKDHNITGNVSEAGDRQYYLDSMRGNSGVELIFNSRATNQTILAFYSPVYYQGNMIGSLIGVYEESRHLNRLLTMDMFGCKAEAYLCNEDGIIISSNQGVDTTAEVPIETVLGPRVSKDIAAAGLIYKGEQTIVPLEGNRMGACVTGLNHSGWYVIQIFPNEANEMMVAKANQIGMESAACTVTLLAILLILTYSVLSKANQETQKALVESEAASKAKTDFLFSMSHDIRTPINAIIGFLRLLAERQEDPEKRREYILKIKSASELLLSIINNVLEMSKIEGGADVLEEEVWSAQQMVDVPCTLISPQMEEKQITLETAVDVRHPFVWCDRAKVQEIYLNLLNNACQYTLNGGKVSIRLTEIPSDMEGKACFKTEITDTGIGIKKEFMPHLFETFAREQDTTHSKIAGAGLGLPIVKRLTERMGGSVSVESEAGKGTKVTVILPYRIASEPEIQGRRAEAPAPTGFSEKRILLAEDNELNAEIAMELLRGMGLTVEWARDGDICVAMVDRSAPYDLILMDIQMPNMNGYQAAEAIRGMADPAKAGIPIVAMTANAFEEDKENAYAAGMDAHLAKPIDIPKLTQTLTDILK